MAVHKKHEEKKEEEKKNEPVVVSDVVTETTERIEVVEEVSDAKDPLADFKEKMSEEEFLPSDESAKKNFMWPILFVVFLALALLGGIFVYKKGMISNEKVNVVTLTPPPTVIAEPTKAEIDLSKYAIKILNGGGVSGEAARQKDSLEAKGFTISTVGNADNSDYTETIIQAKEKVDKDFIAKLKSVLEDTFIVGEIEALSEDASTPIVVILGTKK